MAIYHLSVKTVSRSTGRSAVAAAAYRAAQRLEDARTGLVHDFEKKLGVLDVGLIMPPEFALSSETKASSQAQRQQLWNLAEAAENRKNSTTAREWEIALPAELPLDAQKRLVERFSGDLASRYKVGVDWAIHAPLEASTGNVHAHILTTTRVLGETKSGQSGFGAKTRILDDQQTGREEIKAMREHWANICNHELARYGLEERIDHRSLEAQREALGERIADEGQYVSLEEKAAYEDLKRAPQLHRGAARTHGVAFADEERERLREDAPRLQSQKQAREVAQAQALRNWQERQEWIAYILEHQDALHRFLEERPAPERDWDRFAEELEDSSFWEVRNIYEDTRYQLMDEQHERERLREAEEKEAEVKRQRAMLDKVQAELDAEAVRKSQEMLEGIHDKLVDVYENEEDNGALSLADLGAGIIPDLEPKIGESRKVRLKGHYKKLEALAERISHFWDDLKSYLSDFARKLVEREGYSVKEGSELADNMAEQAIKADPGYEAHENRLQTLGQALDHDTLALEDKLEVERVYNHINDRSLSL